MPGVLFHFEHNDIDVWSGRAVDLDAWYFISHNYGFDKLAVVNCCDYDFNLGRVPVVEEFSSMSAFLAAHGTERLVTLECPWNILPTETPTNVEDFAPGNGDYWVCVGPANGWQGVRPSNELVTVPQVGVDPHHGVFIATIFAYFHHLRINE